METNAKKIERDLRKAQLDLEALIEKKGVNRNEHEQLDSILGNIKISFEEALHNNQSQNESSKDLFARLEHIRTEKERIMRDDQELEKRERF